MNRAFSTLAITLFVCTAPLYVFAHGDESSFEKEVGTYTVDVGYEPGTFSVGAPTRFDFRLRNAALDEVPYDHVWVRVLRAGDTLLATGVRRQEIGPTTLLYAFAEPGDYTLDVSYRTIRSGEIASSTFPITVQDFQHSMVLSSVGKTLVALVVGLFVGTMGAALFWGKRGKTELT